jgi:hypothetical protein
VCKKQQVEDPAKHSLVVQELRAVRVARLVDKDAIL